MIIIALTVAGCSGLSGKDMLPRDTSFSTFSGNGPFLIKEGDKTVFSSPGATDYVAVMERTDAPDDKVIVYRSANILREDRYQFGWTRTNITDLKNGISIQYSGLPRHRETLIISGSAKSRGTTVYLGKGEDTVLDEKCHIWSFDGADRYGDKCLTDDGIVLWQKNYDRGGSIERHYRAVSLVRRALGRDELSVPVDLLEWPTWMAPLDPDAEHGPNDQVILYGRNAWNGASKAQMIRRLGDNIATWKWEQRNLRQMLLKWPGAMVRFDSDEDGVPLELAISRTGGSLLYSPSKWEAENPRKSEFIRGYSCSWRTTIRASEGDTRECRTANGMLLKNADRYISQVTELTAASASVGKLTEADFRPPAKWLTLGFWATSIVSSQK